MVWLHRDPDWFNIAGYENVSYFAGIKADETKHETILLGDSNVSGGGGGLDVFWTPEVKDSIDASWENTLHVNKGNITLSDGSVHLFGTPALRDQIALAFGKWSDQCRLLKTTRDTVESAVESQLRHRARPRPSSLVLDLSQPNGTSTRNEHENEDE